MCNLLTLCRRVLTPFAFQIVNTAYEAVPVIIRAIYSASEGDEERAVKFIQLLDELSDSVPLVFDPHLKIVVEMCLALGKEERLGDQVRIKALAFLGLLVTKKKKVSLSSRIVRTLLMCTANLNVAVPTCILPFVEKIKARRLTYHWSTCSRN